MRKTVFTILLAAALPVVYGCQQKENPDALKGSGNVISFGGSVSAPLIQTKAGYASPSNGDILWSTGDQIQIQAHNGGTSYTGNYTVNQSAAQSPVSYDSGTQLSWWADQYTFYGFYPASLGGQFTVSGEVLSNLSLSSAQSQDGQIDHLYMFARNLASESGGTVRMDFYPLVTTVGITIRNNRSESVTLSEISLSSSGQDLCGTYSISMNGSAPDGSFSHWPSSVSGGSRSVYANGGITLAAKQTQTLYLFLVPQAYDAASLTLTLVSGDKTYAKTMADIFAVNSLEPAHKYGVSVTMGASGGVSISATAKELLCGLLNHDLGRRDDIKALIQNALSLPNKPYDGSGSYDIDYTYDENGELMVRYQGASGSSEWEVIPDDTIAELCAMVTDMTGSQGDLFPRLTEITPTELAPFVNLSTVNLELNGVITLLDLSGLSSITVAKFNHPKRVNVSDCSSLTTLELNNLGTSSDAVTIDSCPNLENLGLYDSSSARSYTLRNLPKLSGDVSFSTASDITLDGCGAVTGLNVYTANQNLTEIRLYDIPVFAGGYVSNIGLPSVDVYARNVSTGLSDGQTAVLHMNGKGVFVEKSNSDKLVLE